MTDSWMLKALVAILIYPSTQKWHRHSPLIILSAGCLLTLTACGVPSETDLQSTFQQQESRLTDLQRNYCGLVENTHNVRFVSVLSRRNIDDRIDGNRSAFLAEDNNREALQLLNEELKKIGGNSITIIRTKPGSAYATDSVCSIRISMFSRGFISNSLLTGFEYNPPNENIVASAEDVPERWGPDPITYRYKLNNAADDHWYVFFERY